MRRRRKKRANVAALECWKRARSGDDRSLDDTMICIWPARSSVLLLLVLVLVLADATLAFDSSFVQLLDDAITVLFPPVRISAHLCRLDQGEAVELSRTMSRKGLAHEIHLGVEAFETRAHDTWEHQILYVLDLDCDYALPLLTAANSSGMFMAPIKWLLLRDLDGSSREPRETFRDMAVYPDSEVILATRTNGVDFTEITSAYRPSPVRELVLENRGNWTTTGGLTMSNIHPASRRRSNLRGTPLKSCLVMTDADTINHLTDYENKHIDPVTKANYGWMLLIASRMNATISFRITDNWGYREANGSWNGMTGMLDRREIDIGGTGTFLVSQRLGVIDYVQLYTHTSSCVVFRKPLLSTVSNIFRLPFQRSVWIAIGVFLLLAMLLLHVSSSWEYRRGMSGSNAAYYEQFSPAEQTISDTFMIVLGAVAQQGYSYEPYRVPPRIVTLMLLIASLSLYASYTANIVALLQSTTDSIKTLEDLLHSPLKIAAQDVVYARYYSQTFQDPVRKAIVDNLNRNNSWITIQEGVRRVKDELFAFHGETGTVYQIMQETYQEEEKCGITQLDLLNMLYPLLVIQHRSPYLEIVKNTALLLRETGLKYRAENRLYTSKPKCHGQTGFISIGFTECYFALVSMGYGTLLGLLVLVAELVWHGKIKSIRLRGGKFDSSVAQIRDETAGHFEEGSAEERYPSDSATDRTSDAERRQGFEDWIR